MQTLFIIVTFFLKMHEAQENNKFFIDAVYLKLNEDPVLQGNNFTFECSLDITKADESQQPKFNYSLFKDNRLLKKYTSDATTQLFAIQGVVKSHSGSYVCQVSYYGPQFIEKKSEALSVDVKGNWTKPVLKVSPKHVVVGGTVSLHCEAPKEIPPMKFLFFINNQKYQTHEGVAENGNYLVYNHTIQNIKQNNVCCAVTGKTSWNTNDQSFSDKMDIEVVDPISNFTLEVFPSNRLNEGDSFNMTCALTWNLLEAKPEIDITKDNVLLHNTSSIRIGKLYGRTFSKNAFVTDKGHYKCKVRINGVMQYREDFIFVDVLLSTPELWREPNISEVVRGHNITLLCKSDNKLDQVKYTFYRKTATLVTRNVSRNVSARFILTINDNADLEGYKCKAENGNESFPLSPKYSKGLNFTLIVPVSKPELSILQNTSEVLLGTSVKLLCRSPSGTDPIFYSLFKGEKFMKTANGSVVDGVQFNISILQESDYGAYQCKAENRAPNMSKYSEKRNITILDCVGKPPGGNAQLQRYSKNESHTVIQIIVIQIHK
ncbi:platelet endothelial cell adhesion molecule-like [Protopterus annectens]|uniref:platelet endothelial cell adhesion molecule-like n=1 Tax=Protopterus annectens TaxID=7888 RepID=UPI001CFAC78D|nr:platelet endothelial cell adhesion molecule-like [Protopterus annectens]